MTDRAMWAALTLAAALAAGCTDSARAPAQADDAAPDATAPADGEAVAPVATVDEPAGPAAPAARPIDEGAFRALAEEVAKLRAQLASMQKSAAAPKARLIEPVQPPEVALEAEEAGEFEDDGPQPEIVEVNNETYVEREVPVYVDREVVVQSEPTVILERVSYGDACCDQWIPCGHTHYIGCGHHYYGCSCHPWYYDLHSGVALNFSCAQKDTEVAVHRSGGGGGGGRRRNRDVRPGLSGATAANGDGAAGTDVPGQAGEPGAAPAPSRTRPRRPSGRQRDVAPPATPAPAPALVESDTRVAFDAPEPERVPQAQRGRGRNRSDDRAGQRNDRDDRVQAQPAAEEPRAEGRGRAGRDDRPARAERDAPADHPQRGGHAQGSRQDPAAAPPPPRPNRQRKGD